MATNEVCYPGSRYSKMNRPPRVITKSPMNSMNWNKSLLIILYHIVSIFIEACIKECKVIGRSIHQCNTQYSKVKNKHELSKYLEKKF